MAFDFSAIRDGKMTYADLVNGISLQDLRQQTRELFDTISSIIAGATDATVTFVPNDPQAAEGDERGWTLGHVLVHLTASLEEGAATSATLARGVAVEQRLRYEVPWENVTTIKQVQDRLQESLRMCNAFLDTWPTQPDFSITVVRVPFFGPMNAIGAYMLGVFHGQMHLEQLQEIMRQSK